MAQITGTTDSYDIGSGGGIREDLEDVIYDLFPMETYAVTNFEKVTATNTFHEWLTDALAGATANRQVEGDDAGFVTVTAPTRVGNYTQISRKDFLISGTLEAVTKAGRKSEIARQAMKKMRELKRDMENALMTNQASSAGGQSTARSSGGLESWIASTDNGGNGFRATTTSSASTVGFSSGVVAAPTDGTTTGALTEAVLKNALEAAWSNGGNARNILVSSTQKKVIDGFSGIATKYNRVDGAQQATLIGALDVYVSDFGNHQIMLHRYMRTSIVLALDPDYWAVAYLEGRRPKMEELAKTGDGEKRQIITEFCLVSRNALSSAKVVACA